MKVIKFGGSSLANATQLRKVLNIVKSDPERKIVVVSAPGKRFKEDKKVTDELIEFARLVLNEMPYETIQEEILNRYREITEDLKLNYLVMEKIEKHFEKLLRTNFESNNLLIEAFKASGEDNHAKLIAAFLEQEGIPARYMSPQDAGIFVTSEPGNATILPESYNFLRRLREMDEVLVIPGFFGYNEREEIITFSRGGSDITGAIVANGVQADLYENFTDVDAIYVANPHYIPNSKKINHLTYREMRELSYSGFSVFHDEALLPAFSGGIPVSVKNTNNPNGEGTKITRTKPKSDTILSGIASSSGFISIHISKYLMNREIGFIRKVAQIFEELQLNLDHMPSGIDEINIILKRDQLTPGKQAALLYRLKNELQSDEVRIQANVCLVMLVGEGMVASVGTTATATQALADAGVNLVMINQGSSEISMMFGIVETDEEKAVKAIYQAFF
ncbi:aspartate kinase [Jeotgalibaca sp. MA1X17-3]|uniref:aspartate kinase n=1 Tax=Jeotgalibaca sp. MA1X17-3 TaxID=2908211 RepID=UPI001F30062D|nr:aspartate kinase [Jeotgalibaca sp. MA1X17-3]UJF16531.1 aspartate kinase [Jeotgalibaca sp. MA1X17-3]